MRAELHDENGVMQQFVLHRCESPPLHLDVPVPNAGVVRDAKVSENDVALVWSDGFKDLVPPPLDYTVDHYELVGIYDGVAMYQRVGQGVPWPST